MSGRRNAVWWMAGAACGAVVAFWSPSPLVIVGWLALGWWGLRRLVPDAAERRWVGRWLIVGLAVRLVLAAAGMAYAWHTGIGSDLFGDARAYSYSGNYIAEVLRGEPLPARYVGNDAVGLAYLREINRGALPPRWQYQVGGMGYWIGWLYAAIGYSPLTVKWSNACLNLVTAALLYDMVKRMAGIAAARAALLLMLGWPSTLLWSVTGLKDAIATAGLLVPLWLVARGQATAAAMGCLLALGGERVWPWLLPIAVIGIALARSGARRAGFWVAAVMATWLGLFGLMAVREEVARLVAAVLVAGVVLAISWRWKRGAVVVAAAALAVAVGWGGPEIVGRGHAVAEAMALRAVNVQTAGSRYPGTMYRIYPQRFLDAHPFYDRAEPLRMTELLVAYLRGLAFLVGAPFPWDVRSWSQLMALPQMVVSYWLWPVALIGIGCWVRARWRETAIVLLVCVVVASVYALTLWNVGATMRLRDILTPYGLAFAATGLARLVHGVETKRVR